MIKYQYIVYFQKREKAPFFRFIVPNFMFRFFSAFFPPISPSKTPIKNVRSFSKNVQCFSGNVRCFFKNNGCFFPNKPSFSVNICKRKQNERKGGRNCKMVRENAGMCRKMQECAKICNLGRVMTSPSTPRFPAALPLPP